MAAIMGLETVLDHVEDFAVDWVASGAAIPVSTSSKSLGIRARPGCGGWRFGGPHDSLNVLVVDGVVCSSTPCFLGADPASSPLVGDRLLRPLAGWRTSRGTGCGRCRPRPRPVPCCSTGPSDIVGGDRIRISDGDEIVLLPEI